MIFRIYLDDEWQSICDAASNDFVTTYSAIAVGVPGDRHPYRDSLELAEKLLGSRLITPPLDQDIEAVPTLIDGPPETMAGLVDRATPLLQIPFVPKSGRWRRHALADACLNCRPQERPASYVRLMPRSAISASTSRSRRPKRKYSQTQWLRQIRRAQVG